MSKYKFVYHASLRSDIEEFEPRREHVRDPSEGPRVFATPSKTMATMFMVDTDGSWVASGLQNKVPYTVISDRKRFEASDYGGTIYTLPGDAFSVDLNRGMGEMEVTSETSVRPIAKETYPSALKAMLDHGVQVYFVDKKTFDSIKSAEDHGLAIKQSIQSENQKLGCNVRSFVPGSETWPE